MRRPLLLTLAAMLVLTGCLEADAPRTRDDATVAGPTSGCPRVEVVPEHVTIQTGEMGEIAYRVLNCGETEVRYPRYSCRSDAVVVHIVGEGVTLRIFEFGMAMIGEPERICEEDELAAEPRTLAPGEALEQPAVFTGAYAVCEKDCRGMGRGWAMPGAYRLAVEFTDVNGRVSRGVGNLTLTPPVLPPYDEDGPVRFVMGSTYRVGEKVDVRVENRGNETYSYSTHYAACDADFYNATGYGFLVPPGTHCDIANRGPLRPGQTITLFTWDLSVCTVDVWGCAESEPLPPGDYHVRLDFPLDDGNGWTAGPGTVAGWDFTIVA